MKDRITKFLTKENITPAEFADKIGVQRSSVSHVLNGRNYPSASFIQKMLMVYPQLNPRWLLLGEGTMMMTAIQNAPAPSLFDFPVSKENVATPLMQIPKNELENLQPVKPFVTKDQSLPNKPEDKPSIEVEVSRMKETDEKPLDINPIGNKDIEKIIVLYKDKTFTSYSPS